MQARISDELKAFTVPLASVQPDPQNARKRTPQNLAAIKSSFERFGQVRPLVVYRFGKAEPPTVIAGNGGWLAAKELGWEGVAVVPFTGTAEEARAYAIADNRAGELSEWDLTILAAQSAVMRGAPDLRALYANLELERVLPKAVDEDVEDAIPEVPTKPTTRTGDLYALGEHRLLCGDCRDEQAMARLIEPASAHMVFTDPPWNVAYGTSNNPRYKKRTIENDDLGAEFGPFLAACFERIGSACLPGAMVYVVMSPQEWGVAMQEIATAGFGWSSTIVWAKNRLVMQRKDYHTQYEPIWYGWRGGRRASRRSRTAPRATSGISTDRRALPTIRPRNLLPWSCVRSRTAVGMATWCWTLSAAAARRLSPPSAPGDGAGWWSSPQATAT